VPGLHLILVRVYCLAQPLIIPMQKEYGGCKSWVSISVPLEQLQGTPVLSDDIFAGEKQKIAVCL
jgi:hypothetical protein